MIKLGTTDINKVYLGSTDINKAYLGETVVHTVGDDPLPIQLGADSWHNFTNAADWVEGDINKVGSWLDSSGNGNDISQITGLNQPGFTLPNGPINFSKDQILENFRKSLSVELKV